MFKNVKPVVFIILAHLMVFSILMIVFDFGTESYHPDLDEMVKSKRFYSQDSMIVFDLYNNPDGNIAKSALTYNFVDTGENLIVFTSGKPMIDSVVTDNRNCYIYTGNTEIEKFELSGLVKGNVAPVVYVDGKFNAPAGGWFTLGRIGGIAGLLLCGFVIYIIYAETKRK